MVGEVCPTRMLSFEDGMLCRLPSASCDKSHGGLELFDPAAEGLTNDDAGGKQDGDLLWDHSLLRGPPAVTATGVSASTSGGGAGVPEAPRAPALRPGPRNRESDPVLERVLDRAERGLHVHSLA